MPDMKCETLDKLGSFFPYAIIVLLIFGLIIAYLLQNVNLVIKGLILIIPLLLASIYLPHIYKYDINFNHYLNIFSFKQKTLSKIFAILYFISIISLLISFPRPWYYFILMGLMYTILFIQLFSPNFKINILLFELIFLLLNFTYGVTFTYPLYFGTTDILPHINYSQITFLMGQVLPENFTNYTYFPLYHILIAESSNLLNLDIKTSLFLVTGPIFTITILFVYNISKELTKNDQISILACLLYLSSSVVLFSSTNFVTRHFAFVGFVILMYFIFANHRKKNTTTKILSILIIIFMFLAHQVSLAQISIILLILLLCELIINNKRYITSNFYFLFNILFLSYWFYVAYSFINKTIEKRINLDFFLEPILISSSSVTGGSSFNPYLYLISNVNIIIFLFLTLIGIGYILKKKNKTYLPVVAFFSLLTLILYVKNPIHLLWQTLELFQFDRFKLIIVPFMSLIMSLGMFTFLSYIFKKKNTNKKAIFVLILFFLFVIPSIIYSVPDGNVYQDDKRNYFNNQELTSFNYATTTLPSEVTIYSDYNTIRFLHSNNIRDVSYINEVNDFVNMNGFVVIRKGMFLEYGLPFREKNTIEVEGSNYIYRPTIKNIKKLNRYLTIENKIYTNSMVNIYNFN